MWRNWRIKPISFRGKPVFRCFRPCAHRLAVRAFAGACLHGFPIHSVQCGDEEGGENGLSHIRVRAGHEISSHREAETVRAVENSLRAWIMADTRSVRIC